MTRDAWNTLACLAFGALLACLVLMACGAKSADKPTSGPMPVFVAPTAEDGRTSAALIAYELRGIDEQMGKLREALGKLQARRTELGRKLNALLRPDAKTSATAVAK